MGNIFIGIQNSFLLQFAKVLFGRRETTTGNTSAFAGYIPAYLVKRNEITNKESIIIMMVIKIMIIEMIL